MWYLTQRDESRPSKVTYEAVWPNRRIGFTMGVEMSCVLPGAEVFSTPVYGTVFARRTETLHRLQSGDRLILVPDPPGAEPPTVWVHARGGDVVGHLSPDISAWMAPWMLAGSCYGAEVAVIRGDDVASWKRLVITVRRVRRPAFKSA